MLWLIILLLSLIDIPENDAISLKIDGKIDLGPKWNFEYSFMPADDESVVKRSKPVSNILRSQIDETFDNGNVIISMEIPTTKRHKKVKKKKKEPKPVIKIQIDTDQRDIKNTKATQTTKLINTTSPTKKHKKRKPKIIKNTIIRGTSDLYDRPHRVGEDRRVKKFILHLYRKSLNYFNKIRGRINNSKKINNMLRSYKNRFTEFINETQNVKIKTRLGTQKVMLNTLEMSNRMLRRIVNYIIANTEDNTVLRQGQNSINSVLNKGLEKEIKQEYVHLCINYGICRSGYGFTNFLADIINGLLVVSDKELKKTADSLTEVAKNTDFTVIFDKRTNKKFLKGIDAVERWNNNDLRAKFMTLKNVLVAKNQPLLITDGMSVSDLNRTLALLEVLNILHETIPTNKVNAQEWKDIRHSVRDYARGYRHDIQEIMTAFFDHIYKRGIIKLNWKDAESVSNNLKIMLS